MECAWLMLIHIFLFFFSFPLSPMLSRSLVLDLVCCTTCSPTISHLSPPCLVFPSSRWPPTPRFSLNLPDSVLRCLLRPHNISIRIQMSTRFLNPIPKNRSMYPEYLIKSCFAAFPVIPHVKRNGIRAGSPPLAGALSRNAKPNQGKRTSLAHGTLRTHKGMSRFGNLGRMSGVYPRCA
ncbi:hypothetical protein K438DRAFT_588897 [Mycena galopus ATCC 62051]|nr:hypothetical protein K438DRAFT_588897 [Mycena galopus ATCC 62051]